MTTKQMMEVTKEKRYLRVPSSNGKTSILVEVRVVDTRSQFGRTDALITPVNGSGEMWVAIDSLREQI